MHAVRSSRLRVVHDTLVLFKFARSPLPRLSYLKPTSTPIRTRFIKPLFNSSRPLASFPMAFAPTLINQFRVHADHRSVLESSARASIVSGKINGSEPVAFLLPPPHTHSVPPKPAALIVAGNPKKARDGIESEFAHSCTFAASILARIIAIRSVSRMPGGSRRCVLNETSKEARLGEEPSRGQRSLSSPPRTARKKLGNRRRKRKRRRRSRSRVRKGGSDARRGHTTK